jgi:hypothetical protein
VADDAGTVIAERIGWRIWPIMVAVSDDVLSEAVTVCVWGSPLRPWPSGDREAVVRVFGDKAQCLLFRMDELRTELDQMRPDDDPAEFGYRIEQSLRSSDPGLSSDAHKALAALFTYAWR